MCVITVAQAPIRQVKWNIFYLRRRVDMNFWLVMLIQMNQTLTGLTPLTPDPLVTYYDCASGERTELSGITMSNWVAKVSNFLVDDLDVEIGTRLRIGLPAHWLRFVWLLSCWNTGVVVADNDASIGLSGPELQADEPAKLASALAPFGMRFTQAPHDFIDIGIEVLGHSDHFEPFDIPQSSDLAWDLAGNSQTHGQALAAAGAGNPNRILIQDTNLVQDAQLIISAILGGGSVVVARNANADELTNLAAQENASLLTLPDLGS